MVLEGIDAKIISLAEADEIRKYDQLLADVVDVDDFDPDIYKTLR